MKRTYVEGGCLSLKTHFQISCVVPIEIAQNAPISIWQNFGERNEGQDFRATALHRCIVSWPACPGHGGGEKEGAHG
jgi:hypothetical protein